MKCFVYPYIICCVPVWIRLTYTEENEIYIYYDNFYTLWEFKEDRDQYR